MTDRDVKALLGRNIKRIRLLRKLSQADFAEKMDISVPFLSDIENGKKWVSPATLAKIADAMNIQVYELLKPETALPDFDADILEKYTADIFGAIGETLDNIRDGYMRQLNDKTGTRRQDP